MQYIDVLKKNKKKNILFKVCFDKKKIGSGHYFQSINLANKLIKNYQVYFYMNKNSDIVLKKSIKYFFQSKIDTSCKTPDMNFDLIIFDFPTNKLIVQNKNILSKYVFITNSHKKIISNADLVIATNQNQKNFLYKPNFLTDRKNYLIHGKFFTKKNYSIKKNIKKIIVCFSSSTIIKNIFFFLNNINNCYNELKDIEIDFYLQESTYKKILNKKIKFKININFFYNNEKISSNYDLCYCTLGNIFLNALEYRVPSIVLFNNKKNAHNFNNQNTHSIYYSLLFSSNLIEFKYSLKFIKSINYRFSLFKKMKKINLTDNTPKIVKLLKNLIDI